MTSYIKHKTMKQFTKDIIIEHVIAVLAVALVVIVYLGIGINLGYI